jgi:hypothetical protein
MFDLEYQRGGWLPEDTDEGELVVTTTAVRPAPRWVVEGWLKALKSRGVLPKAPETTQQTATEV